MALFVNMETLGEGTMFGYYWGILWSFIATMYFPIGLLVSGTIIYRGNEKKLSWLVFASAILLIGSRIPIFMMTGLKILSTQEYTGLARPVGVLWFMGMLGVLVAMIILAQKIKGNTEQAAGGDATR